MATAIADKKGMKRICPGCSTRYYDFNKRPVLCPNCKMEFTGEIKLKARRSRAAANDIVEDQVDDTPIADKDDDTIIEGDDVVSLEEIEDEEVEDEDDADPDLELDEDDLDDLEDEDEDEDLDEDEDEDEDDEDDEDDGGKAKKKSSKKR